MLEVKINILKQVKFDCPYCEKTIDMAARKFCMWCSNEIGGIYNLHNDPEKRIKYYMNKGRI